MKKFSIEKFVRSLTWFFVFLALGGAIFALVFDIPILLFLPPISVFAMILGTYGQYHFEKKGMEIEATWPEYMRFTLPRYFFILFPFLCALGLYAIIDVLLETTDLTFFLYFNLIIILFFLVFSFLPWPRIFALVYNAKEMTDRQMLSRIQKLTRELGLRAGGTFILSWKSMKVANAFQVGTFSAYSVFLSDYMLSQLEPQEVDAIVAHELAHAKCKHSLKRVLMIMPLTLAGANVIVYLAYYASYYAVPDAITVVSTLLLSASLFIATPILSLALSRGFELKADELAATVLGPEAVISALIKLQHLNLAADDMRKWRRLFSSHPPISLRIQRIRANIRKSSQKRSEVI
jgi:STE24 endopeptidase